MCVCVCIQSVDISGCWNSLVPYPFCLCVCHQRVCLVGELWKNGWLDLDAIWGVECGWNGVLDGGGDHRWEWAVWGVNVVHSIVTDGDCGVVILCHEGCRRGCSQIILGFLVTFKLHMWHAVNIKYAVKKCILFSWDHVGKFRSMVYWCYNVRDVIRKKN